MACLRNQGPGISQMQIVIRGDNFTLWVEAARSFPGCECLPPPRGLYRMKHGQGAVPKEKSHNVDALNIRIAADLAVCIRRLDIVKVTFDHQ